MSTLEQTATDLASSAVNDYKLSPLMGADIGYVPGPGETVGDVMERSGVASIRTELQPLFSTPPGSDEPTRVKGSAVYGIRPDPNDETGLAEISEHWENVGGRFTTVQNVTLARLIDGVDGITPTRIGTVDDGRGTFIECRMPDGLSEIRDGDVVETFLRVVTRHDGKSRVRLWLDTNRFVCLNQTRASFSNAKDKALAWGFAHTTNVETAIARVCSFLNGQLPKARAAYVDTMRQWAETPISESEWRTVVERALPLPARLEKTDGTPALPAENKREARRLLSGAIDHPTTQHGRDGDRTLWDALQAASFFSTHVWSPDRKGTPSSERRYRDAFSPTGLLAGVTADLAELAAAN